MDTQKVFEPRLDSFMIFHYLLGQVIRVNVDADCADHTKLLTDDRDRRALKSPGPDIQLVVEFIFVLKLAFLQVDEQIRRAIAQMSTGHIILQDDERMRRIGQVVEQNLNAGIWK